MHNTDIFGRYCSHDAITAADTNSFHKPYLNIICAAEGNAYDICFTESCIEGCAPREWHLEPSKAQGIWYYLCKVQACSFIRDKSPCSFRVKLKNAFLPFLTSSQ